VNAGRPRRLTPPALFCIGAAVLLAPQPAAGQQRYTFRAPPAAAPPPLLVFEGPTAAAQDCPAPPLVACAAGADPSDRCAEIGRSTCDGDGARRASAYPVVVVYTFVGGVVGGAALAAVGYGLGSLADDTGDPWISASGAFGALGFVVGYPVGGAIGAVASARQADLSPHGGTVVLTSFLTAAAGGVTAVGVARVVPSGVAIMLGATIHAVLTGGAAVVSGR
jgi:hypothetical protein